VRQPAPVPAGQALGVITETWIVVETFPPNRGLYFRQEKSFHHPAAPNRDNSKKLRRMARLP
jgi:hypothetical protein